MGARLTFARFWDPFSHPNPMAPPNETNVYDANQKVSGSCDTSEEHPESRGRFCGGVPPASDASPHTAGNPWGVVRES